MGAYRRHGPVIVCSFNRLQGGTKRFALGKSRMLNPLAPLQMTSLYSGIMHWHHL
jgi:hypothetical protein